MSAKNLLAVFLPNLWWILSIWKLLDMKDGTPLLYYTFFWASSCIERSQKGKNYMVKGINRAKTLLLLGKIFTKWYHIECRQDIRGIRAAQADSFSAARAPCISCLIECKMVWDYSK